MRLNNINYIKIGWQIDPFGHSREMASIFAQMGYDGLFFGRLDHEDKVSRLETRKPEFVWHGSANLGMKMILFTSDPTSIMFW